MSDWWGYPIGHGYITDYQGPNTDTPHYADDVETPYGTPISTLFEGDVMKPTGYEPWGGQVFIKPNPPVPGLPAGEEYFYHFDQIQVRVGQHVKRGQQIGLSGGQTSGGTHPTDPHYSTGPHTHVGLWTKYVASPGGGTIPYGPDITSWIKSGGAPGVGEGGDSCTQGLKDGMPWQKVPACQVANWCFDPTQCVNYITSGGKVSAMGPAMGDTGPAGAGKDAGTAFTQWLETQLGVESTKDLFYRIGFIGGGAILIIIGLLIFGRGLSPVAALAGG